MTFKEVIIAEGSRNILDDIKEEMETVSNQLGNISDRLNGITTEQAKITRSGKDIKEKYLEALKSYIDILQVADIDSSELKSIKTSFDSGGNDLSIAVLAQIFALRKVSKSNRNTVEFPIVLDAVFQQEPSASKIELIWNFLMEHQPENSQMVIATTDLHGYEPKGKIIRLHNKTALFNKEDYIKESNEISFYEDLMLKYINAEAKK